jgi:hypothetical protein
MEEIMKVPSILTGILSMFLLSVSFSGQTRSVSALISDESPADSPLRVTGQVLFEENLSEESNSPSQAVGRSTIDAGLTNVSSKAILCYQIAFDLSPANGGGKHSIYNDDRFFGEELQPGSFYRLQEKPGGWEISPSNPKLLLGTARVRAKVVFVEFSDGSRFGSSPWGDHLSADRGNAIATLNSLLKSYEGGGNVQLAQELQRTIANPTESRTSITSAVVYHIKSIFDMQGSGATATEIQRYLNNANKRKQAM